MSISKLPSIMHALVPQLMLATRLPTPDTQVGYSTQDPFGDRQDPILGMFFSYYPKHVHSEHPVVPQVRAWDDQSVRQIKGILIRHMKAMTKIGGFGSVRTFTAGRYSGVVVTENASSTSGDASYTWHYHGITYLLGFLVIDGRPNLAGMNPKTIIASFRRT